MKMMRHLLPNTVLGTIAFYDICGTHWRIREDADASGGVHYLVTHHHFENICGVGATMDKAVRAWVRNAKRLLNHLQECIDTAPHISDDGDFTIEDYSIGDDDE